MQLLLSLVDQYGLLLVFANVLAVQLGLPLPAYPTLILVGALSSRGDFTIPQLLVVAVVASVIADLAWYVAGTRIGRRVLSLMCRLSLSPDSCVRQSERIYERWGAPSLMLENAIAAARRACSRPRAAPTHGCARPRPPRRPYRRAPAAASGRRSVV